MEAPSFGSGKTGNSDYSTVLWSAGLHSSCDNASENALLLKEMSQNADLCRSLCRAQQTLCLCNLFLSETEALDNRSTGKFLRFTSREN